MGVASMKLLSNLEAARRLGVSVTVLWRLQHAADFPKPIRLTGPRGKPQWDEADLDAFVSRRRAPI
jgi:predicted DNA-binding transcriptional regulator AlpA